MATRKEAAKIIDEFEEGFRLNNGRKLKKKELIDLFKAPKDAKKLKKKSLERFIKQTK
jgi:hypothetical protein